MVVGERGRGGGGRGVRVVQATSTYWVNTSPESCTDAESSPSQTCYTEYRNFQNFLTSYMNGQDINKLFRRFCCQITEYFGGFSHIKMR